MPPHPSSIHKLAGILKEARSPKPMPFFRRRDLQALFGLHKRQAVNLMHRIGALRVRRELAVDQRDLVRWLEQQLAAPAAEWRRHERVIEQIVELKAETAARALKIVLPEGVPATGLPAGLSKVAASSPPVGTIQVLHRLRRFLVLPADERIASINGTVGIQL